MGTGPSALAEGPVSVSSGAVFYGYVLADGQGGLAERVRALSVSGAVCGTAEVIRLSDEAGYYAVSVASSAQKRGCPSAGGLVQFALLAGRVDDGVWAGEVATLTDGGAPVALNLQPAAYVTGHWLGPSGDITRDFWLRWAGPSVPLRDALVSLPLPVSEVYYLDAAAGQFLLATPSTDATLASGDLVLVRFR
ncbi:MAG: hypothetical protein EPO65_01050 [Dehalococcoidia bacterium]|nr:MAG: hypothetical protein EPO65_01050 [Dehalococcoidia bacterium]